MATSDGRSSSPILKDGEAREKDHKHKKRKKEKREERDADEGGDGGSRHKKHKKTGKDREAETNGDVDVKVEVEADDDEDEDKLIELEANQEKEKLLRLRLEVKMKKYQQLIKDEKDVRDTGSSGPEDNPDAPNGRKSPSDDQVDKDERRQKRERERREKRKEENDRIEEEKNKEKLGEVGDAKVVDDMFRDFVLNKMSLLEKESEVKGRSGSKDKEKSKAATPTEKDREKKKKSKKDKKDKDRKEKRDETGESSGFGKFTFKGENALGVVNYSDASDSDSDISMTEIDAMLAGETSTDILDQKKKKKDSKKDKKKEKKKKKEARRSRSVSPSSSDSSVSRPPTPKKKKKKRSRSKSRSPEDPRWGRSTSRREYRDRPIASVRWGDYDDYRSNQRWGPPRPTYGRSRYGRRSRSRSGSRNRDTSKSKSRVRSRSPELKIDKAKLLEIARANALRAMQAGVLPQGVVIPNLSREEEASLKAGGKDLVQLTNFCKKIAEKEKNRKEGDSSDEEDAARMRTDEEDESLNPLTETGAAIHHPFAIKAPTNSITLNIRNSTQLPAKPHEQRTIESSEKLRQVFPVSSGNQHRQKEIEWHEVTPEETAKMVEDKKNLKKQMALMPWVKTAVPKEERVFQEPEADIKNMDIGSVVTERLNAMRKLQDNPHDVEALKKVQKAQDAMQNWAKSKEAPGLFTGSTGIVQKAENILPTGDPRNQAWVRKDMFKLAQPVQSQMGRRLLEKMGWKDGMALGKTNSGELEPLILEVKTDRKGLMSVEEGPKKPVPLLGDKNMPVKDLSGKHPVSALMELASRRKWGPPQWELVETGTGHQKHFMFKVHVGGTWYQPTVASNNKKHAKSMASTVCLQAMGLLPKDAVCPDE